MPSNRDSGPAPIPPLQTARSQGRYVLCTGSKDFNNEDTKATFGGFQQDRFAYAKLQEIDELGMVPPSADDFKKGIESLDAPRRPAPTASIRRPACC